MRGQVVEQLNRHACSIGADVRLVQGAGGNLSGKDGDLVWVKASGTRLAEAADRPVFVGVDGPRARGDVLSTEDLRHLVVELPEGAALRPSIETALHVLMPQRYVFHVHSVGSLGLAVQQDPSAALARLADVAPAAWVPYAKPGIALAEAVVRSLGPAADDAEAVLVLGNHGLVTAAEDADRARRLIDEVEDALRPGPEPAAPEGELALLAPAGTVSAEGARLLTGGVLTPDEAVFLGPRPFGTDEGSPVRITPDGAVLVAAEVSTDARDIALSLLHVAAHADPAQPVRYLDEHEVAVLVDWEAEKWRRAMQR